MDGFAATGKVIAPMLIGKDLAFTRWSAIQSGAIPLRMGVLGTSITDGTSDISYLAHALQGIVNAGYIVEFIKSYAVGGAVLSSISTTQLDSAIAANCNVIMIDGCVNDLPDTADSVATCKTKVQSMITSMKVIWDACFARGIMPIQQVPSVSDNKNAKGTAHAVRMIARAAQRCGVPVISAPYAIMVDPADGFVNATRALDAVHPNNTGAIAMGQAIGDWFGGRDLYSPWLQYGVHDYDSGFAYEGLSLVDTRCFVTSGGVASVAHMTNNTTGGTVTATLATGNVTVGAWCELTRTTTGTVQTFSQSPSGIGSVGDLICTFARIRTSAMAGTRTSVRTRIQGGAFSVSADQRLFQEANYADPGFVYSNTHNVQVANSDILFPITSLDKGSGTNGGVVGIAQMSALNFTRIDSALNAMNLGIPA